MIIYHDICSITESMDRNGLSTHDPPPHILSSTIPTLADRTVHIHTFWSNMWPSFSLNLGLSHMFVWSLEEWDLGDFWLVSSVCTSFRSKIANNISSHFLTMCTGFSYHSYQTTVLFFVREVAHLQLFG